MSDENQTDQAAEQEDGAEPQLSELDHLKAKAKFMGLSHSPNIGVDALRKKINDHVAGIPEAPAVQEQLIVTQQAPAPRVETEAERNARIREEVRSDALRLVRLRITNMNPDKKELHGEIMTVANRFLGEVKKYIPFDEAASEVGYHVPYCLYLMMKDRTFLQKKTRKDARHPGQIHVDQRWVKEFALEVLDPLTPEELNQLAAAQAAARGTA